MPFMLPVSKSFARRWQAPQRFVLSNNDGCVIARSIEAKPYVKMGIAVHKVQKQISVYGINVCSRLFGEISRGANEARSVMLKHSFSHSLTLLAYT